MDTGNHMENVCLCGVMYVGSRIDNCIIAEYSGCVSDLRWMCCEGGVA